MFFITAVALLVMLIIPQGISVGPQTSERCECLELDKRAIGRHLGQVKVRTVSPHCNRVEIIATIKATGIQVCLDPELPWVKKVLQRIKAAEARKAEVTTRL